MSATGEAEGWEIQFRLGTRITNVALCKLVAVVMNFWDVGARGRLHVCIHWLKHKVSEPFPYADRPSEYSVLGKVVRHFPSCPPFPPFFVPVSGRGGAAIAPKRGPP